MIALGTDKGSVSVWDLKRGALAFSLGEVRVAVPFFAAVCLLRSNGDSMTRVVEAETATYGLNCAVEDPLSVLCYRWYSGYTSSKRHSSRISLWRLVRGVRISATLVAVAG